MRQALAHDGLPLIQCRMARHASPPVSVTAYPQLAYQNHASPFSLQKTQKAYTCEPGRGSVDVSRCPLSVVFRSAPVETPGQSSVLRRSAQPTGKMPALAGTLIRELAANLLRTHRPKHVCSAVSDRRAQE